MKRKIALLLALAMTASMLPVNAFANSTNSINKSVSVKDDDMIDGVFIKIVPRDVITTGESIVIDFETAYIPKEGEVVSSNSGMDYAPYHLPVYHEEQQQGDASFSYDSLMAQVQAGGNAGDILLRAINNADGDNYIPWKLSRTSSTSLEVSLFPVTATYCDNNSGTKNTKPNFYIPLKVQADGEGDIKATIDSNESGISGGSTYTIATSTSDSGATTTTVDEIVDFNERSDEITVTIKETVAGSFDVGTHDITLRLNNGFRFVSANTINVAPGVNSPDIVSITNGAGVTYDDDKLTIPLTLNRETTKASSIVISGIFVEPEDDDDDWGAVNLSVKGAGTTSETIQIGNRVDYGMALTANEDPTTILTGYSYVVNDDLDEDDFVTAEVHLEETIADTWDLRQKLYFKLPAGVKIINFETSNEKKMNAALFDEAYLDDEGSTLVIPRLRNFSGDEFINSADETEFDIKFYVTIDPAFGDNDVTLQVYGAGIDEGVIPDVIIAKAVTPITITTETTKTNIGYSALSTADVTITENVAGAILDDQDIYVSLDTLWTRGDMGFVDNSNFKVEAVGGELEIDPFDIKTNADLVNYIKIPVTSTSYTAPGSIQITGVQVGTSRSIPYGDFDLKVDGPAVLNNYDDTVKSDYRTTTKPAGGAFERVDVNAPWTYTQDNTDSYSFEKYLSIGTAPATLDKKVGVTIGSTTITVDDQTYTMDVAPYIQASSDSTLVPLRFVALALGSETTDVESVEAADASQNVTFDSVTKTASIYYGAGTNRSVVQFTAGSNIMVVNGTSVPMAYGVTAEITDSRMFVPFRALGTALGVNVTWDEATRTATYNG